jgi:hypothetical protein
MPARTFCRRNPTTWAWEILARRIRDRLSIGLALGGQASQYIGPDTDLVAVFDGCPHDASPRQGRHMTRRDVMKHQSAIPPPHPGMLLSKAWGGRQTDGAPVP